MTGTDSLVPSPHSQGDGAGARPRLLELYSGASGAGMGYHLAGWDVTCVDIRPQPRCPFPFVQADALEVLAAPAFLAGFDAAHVSPPCQFGTAGAARWGTSDQHPNLIPPTRDLLQASGLPYVIENVEPVRPHLRGPILLCGQMFDLGVFRHRLFEMPWWNDLVPPHAPHLGRIGDGRYVTVTGHPGGSSRRDGIRHGDKAAWQRAMGIDWMTAAELAQAVPPAYTRFIGEALMAHLREEVAA
ncbi:DNA cytosine methyltransferase [Actinomadura sp. 21ATH]|uniref:DNA cytosine methyltransferase n=1 Tax=Actinomadura sp. 21ATH TaxID=1735444 RepID=UPI0035C1BE87